MSQQGSLEVDGRSVWVEQLGSPEDQVVVLLSGATMQATTWEPVFTDPLVASQRAVVRFDWRDIGLSSWLRFSEHPYTIDDLVGDVLAVLDGFTTGSVDVVGFSMGGCVAQLVALAMPERVRSLTLIASGYASTITAERSERSLRLLELLAEPRPATEDEHVDRLVSQWRLLCGRAYAFDDREWEQRACAWIARGQNLACPHLRLRDQVFGVDRRGLLAALSTPTLVVHGDDDSMFPLEHGHALAATLPNSRLHVQRGHGHDLHLDPDVANAVASHLAAHESDPRT